MLKSDCDSNVSIQVSVLLNYKVCTVGYRGYISSYQLGGLFCWWNGYVQRREKGPGSTYTLSKLLQKHSSTLFSNYYWGWANAIFQSYNTGLKRSLIVDTGLEIMSIKQNILYFVIHFIFNKDITNSSRKQSSWQHQKDKSLFFHVGCWIVAPPILKLFFFKLSFLWKY